MNDTVLAIICTISITFVLSIIQLGSDAKITEMSSYWTGMFAIYVFIMIVGNIMTTLTAASVLTKLVTTAKANREVSIFQTVPWAWHTFIGVFGFEALIQKINVTVFDKGVLSINEWITKAKASAVAATLSKSANREIFEKQSLGDKLMAKFSSNLQHIHIMAKSNFGPVKYNEIIAQYGNGNGIEEHLAFILANEKTIVVKAILASH